MGKCLGIGYKVLAFPVTCNPKPRIKCGHHHPFSLPRFPDQQGRYSPPSFPITAITIEAPQPPMASPSSIALVSAYYFVDEGHHSTTCYHRLCRVWPEMACDRCPFRNSLRCRRSFLFLLLHPPPRARFYCSGHGHNPKGLSSSCGLSHVDLGCVSLLSSSLCMYACLLLARKAWKPPWQPP
ncbi:unnamed protein product [Lactuca saligna]|uniref:Uncharacterized protein n=1 Tax=Lactuca saligna TaxID=75948 RepID=A0AA35Z8R1_LACSI|nr:unnamed protein product [Lactuca saligna]